MSGPGPEETTANLEAARDILATIAAARASLLQIAAAHLPFERLVAVHRAASSDAELLGIVDGMIDRRVRVVARGASVQAAPELPRVEPVIAPPEPRTRRRRALPPSEEPAQVVAEESLPPAGIVRAAVTLPPVPPPWLEPAPEPPAPAEPFRRSLTLPPSFPEMPTEEVELAEVRLHAEPAVEASPAESVIPEVAPVIPPSVIPEVAVPPPVEAPPTPRLEPAPVEPAIATGSLLAPTDDLGAISLEELLSGPVRIVLDVVEPFGAGPGLYQEPTGNGELTTPEFKIGSAGSSGSFAIYGAGHQESLDSGKADFAIEAGGSTEEVPIQAPADEDEIEAPPEPSAHSLADLLGEVPEPPPDATLVAGQRLVVSPELSEWAAAGMGEATGELPDAALTPLGEPTGDVSAGLAPATGEEGLPPSRPAVEIVEPSSEFVAPVVAPTLASPAAAPAPVAGMGEEITAVTDMPTLREPRVAGSRGAMVDVRAVGRPPRIAASDEIEGIDSAEIIGEDEPASASEGLSVMFERGSSSAPRVTKAAPQLTEEVEGELTEPVDRITLRRSPVVEETRVQAALDEAQHQARRGDLARSIQAFTDALEMRPTLVDAFIGRGRCHLELGDYSSAMSDFARAEDLNPDRPDPHVAMGDLYFARKEYKRAIEFYDQAVEIDGSHAMARCRRGISHYYRKNYRQAYQDLQRALALDPEIPNMRKYVQMAQKKLERGE